MSSDAQRAYWRHQAKKARQRNRRRPHIHDRGLRLPDGSRTCFRCAVAERLGVRP